MFFDGDLQSGIALALKDSKFVACFVKGSDEQSQLWENVYFKDDQISLALNTRAITLRINSSSQEARYLSAYYPVPAVPALIVIQNGQLVLEIRSGEGKESFKAAILRTLVNTSSYDAAPPTKIVVSSSSTVPSAESRTSTTEGASEQRASQHSMPIDESSDAPSASTQPAMPSETAASGDSVPAVSPDAQQSTPLRSNPSSGQSSQTVQNLLADRRRRLEVDKKAKEAAEKAERQAKANARQAAMTADPNSAKAKQATYAQQQRKRQQETKLERERILRQIEHDKTERKEKDEQRKALAKAEAEGRDGAGGLVDQQLSREMSRGPKPASTKGCAIQVRMFDGSTIRTRFPSDQILRTNVRPWVDKERSDGDSPYTLKQILAPLPNRTLSISEEEESLQSLNLSPSATLVMVPVQGYTAAYAGSQGIVSRGAAAGYNVVSAGAGLVTGALGTFLGLGQATVPAEGSTMPDDTPQAPTSDPRGATSSINIRTLRDQRDDRGEHQLYNGNQASSVLYL